MSRALPWTAVMEVIGEQRFEEIRAVLGREQVDAADRDAFLLQGVVGGMLRELMAPDAPPEAVNAYGALLHMLYLCWSHGWPVAQVAADALRAATAAPAPATPDPGSRTPIYIQLPERMVWAEPVRGAPHEPVDGAFLSVAGGCATALAVLGFREEREGFTTAEAAVTLPAPLPPPRSDGSPPFASLLPAGERAGLLSVADEPELVALVLLALETSPG